MSAARSRVIRAAAAALLAVLAVSVGAAFLEAGICWDAFLRCTEDPANRAFLTGGIYCLNGYIFCRKYIDPEG